MKEHARKVVVGIMGGFVLLVGIALLILPGPAFLVIPAGLAILATEFQWAKRWSDRVKLWYQQQREKHRAKKQKRDQAFST